MATLITAQSETIHTDVTRPIRRCASAGPKSRSGKSVRLTQAQITPPAIDDSTGRFPPLDWALHGVFGGLLEVVRAVLRPDGAGHALPLAPGGVLARLVDR